MKVIFLFPTDALKAFVDAAYDAAFDGAHSFGADALFRGPNRTVNGWVTTGGASYEVDAGSGTLSFEGSRTSLGSGCAIGSVLFSREDGSDVRLLVSEDQWAGEVLEVESSLPELPWWGDDMDIDDVIAARERDDQGWALQERLQ